MIDWTSLLSKEISQKKAPLPVKESVIQTHTRIIHRSHSLMKHHHVKLQSNFHTCKTFTSSLTRLERHTPLTDTPPKSMCRSTHTDKHTATPNPQSQEMSTTYFNVDFHLVPDICASILDLSLSLTATADHHSGESVCQINLTHLHI